ncbi:MAG: hypothetical protein Q9200_001108 [Gallowayella weberi]
MPPPQKSVQKSSSTDLTPYFSFYLQEVQSIIIERGEKDWKAELGEKVEITGDAVEDPTDFRTIAVSMSKMRKVNNAIPPHQRVIIDPELVKGQYDFVKESNKGLSFSEVLEAIAKESAEREATRGKSSIGDKPSNGLFQAAEFFACKPNSHSVRKGFKR